MDYQTLSIIGWICIAIGGIFLLVTIAMFFGFNIPQLVKNSGGQLEQRQIEEIRRNSTNAAGQRNRVNVFEELEKHAKVKKNNTQSLNIGTTTGSGPKVASGTTLLQKRAKSANPNFIIEKDITFVSTNEVM